MKIGRTRIEWVSLEKEPLMWNELYRERENVIQGLETDLITDNDTYKQCCGALSKNFEQGISILYTVE